MIADFHFLRPYWLLSFLPLILLALALWRQKSQENNWQSICDPHLLKPLLEEKQSVRKRGFLFSLLFSLAFIIFALAGPSWIKLPVATFTPIAPRVVVLSLSEDMLDKDITPDRLSRAKFKLLDLFKASDAGQWGMIVYTSEPFVVSPLTEDANTIAALLPSLMPDVMPVQGQNLSSALSMAAKLIRQAGYNAGQILVLTASSPSNQAINYAKTLLEDENINSSILPILPDKDLNPLFSQFAQAGNGELLKLSADNQNILQWLKNSQQSFRFKSSEMQHIPLWRDEGRWFLIPALLFFLPVFRRGILSGRGI